MKIKFCQILFIILFLQIISCNKEILGPNQNQIIGIWKWAFTVPEIHNSDDDRLTPENTGIQELLVYNSDSTWLQYQNDQLTDSGTYTTGHGSYAQWEGGYTYEYDSIVYYKNGILSNKPIDFYDILADTLVFCICVKGQIINDPIPGGLKLYIKQH